MFNKTQPPKKRRKSRTAFTNHQIVELERRFLYQKYLTPVDKEEISQSLGLTNAQVITWFQNRRAKLKRDLEELKADVTAATVLSGDEDADAVSCSGGSCGVSNGCTSGTPGIPSLEELRLFKKNVLKTVNERATESVGGENSNGVVGFDDNDDEERDGDDEDEDDDDEDEDDDDDGDSEGDREDSSKLSRCTNSVTTTAAGIQ